MAQKTLNTRIQNRFDTLANWKVEGVNLLPGEIALVSVTTQQVDPTSGNVVSVPAVLMKVGEEGKTFSQLPWLSAKAADVYDWAKVQYAANIPVTFNDDGTTKETLNDYLVKVDAQSQELAAIKEIFNIVDEGTGSFVTDVSYDDSGNFTITRSDVDTNDIVDYAITEGKIAAGAVTDVKIKDGSVTDAKIGTVSAQKVIVTPASGTEGQEGYQAAVTAVAKFTKIDEDIASLRTSITGGVHFVGTTTTEIADGDATKPVVVDSKNHTPANGDVVIYDEKEFIWVQPEGDTSGHWEELGDLTRVGTLETLTGGLIENERTENKYVTHISKDAVTGELVVNKAQPKADEIIYTEAVMNADGTTVKTPAVTVEDKIVAVDQEVATIESKYVWVGEDNKLHKGIDTEEDYIIFNCGNASSWMS